jgi:hypothetical protein
MSTLGHPYAVNCSVCAEVGVEPNHPERANPELRDHWHGQYDPADPSDLSFTYEPGNS